jgi:uncharacterized glyoxalase superfamily protein PhnB
MSNSVKPIPQGFHTLTPHLCIKGAAKAIDFYKKVFNAKEESRMPGPDGESLMHAKLIIGDSPLFLSDEFPAPNARAKSAQTLGFSSSTIHVYVEDVDAVFERAKKEGAEVNLPVSQMFWGDRYGQFVDPFGQVWSIATHTQDLTEEEIKKGAQQMCANMAVARK